jgi:hypothetical protein
MSYTEALEKQNEQLQQKLASAESVASLWEPVWIFMPGYDEKLTEFWHLTNGFFIHATIKRDLVKDSYTVTIMNNKNIEYVSDSLPRAKHAAMERLMFRRTIRDRNHQEHQEQING